MIRSRTSYVAFLGGVAAVGAVVCVVSLAVGQAKTPALDVPRALLVGAKGRAARVLLSLSRWQHTRDLPFADSTQGLFLWLGGVSDASISIVRQIRLPRLLLALLVGAGLSLVGVVMQGFFQNPMAGPYLVGVSSGAQLGATIAILFGWDCWILGLSSTPLFAFVGALAATFFVYAVASVGGKTPTATLLLTGIAVGTFVSAVSSFLMILDQRRLADVVVWLMGGFASRGWTEVVAVLPYVVVCTIVLGVFGRDLNVMLTGDETAHHLGIEVERVKLVLLVFSSLLAAACVAVSGIIAFVGLVVPHIARHVVGPDHHRLMPSAALAGAVLLAAADVVARLILEGSEVPIGIVTTLLGCPFFIYLLWRSKRLA